MDKFGAAPEKAREFVTVNDPQFGIRVLGQFGKQAPSHRS